MQEIGYKKQVERWDVQEIVLRGKSDKNPFVDYNIFMLSFSILFQVSSGIEKKEINVQDKN